MQPNQRTSSGSQSPRSPQSQPFLSVSVTDPVKLGNGVQAYISYRVITKVISPLDPSLCSAFRELVFFRFSWLIPELTDFFARIVICSIVAPCWLP